MTRLEIIKIVRQWLIKGQIQKALSVLFAYTEGADKDIESEIVLLQASLTTNQEQYEIKQIITKQEHDLAQSRMILAIEHLLEKLPPQSGNAIANDLVDSTNRSNQTALPVSKKWIWAALGLIACIAIVFFVINQNRSKKRTAIPVPVLKEETNFMGNWTANVTKKGYYVERGQKKYFENATATWRVQVLPDHTLIMAGTIDTTGVSHLRWHFDATQQMLTLIQEDDYSFDAKVEINELNRQVWRTIKKEANKVDEWEWSLTK